MKEQNIKTVIFRVTESRYTESGYYIGAIIDNGVTMRTRSFHTWESAFDWFWLNIVFAALAPEAQAAAASDWTVHISFCAPLQQFP